MRDSRIVIPPDARSCSGWADFSQMSPHSRDGLTGESKFRAFHRCHGGQQVRLVAQVGVEPLRCGVRVGAVADRRKKSVESHVHVAVGANLLRPGAGSASRQQQNHSYNRRHFQEQHQPFAQCWATSPVNQLPNRPQPCGLSENTPARAVGSWWVKSSPRTDHRRLPGHAPSACTRGGPRFRQADGDGDKAGGEERGK